MLRLAASLADQAPVSLGEAITGIDDRNVGRAGQGGPPRLRMTPVPAITRHLTQTFLDDPGPAWRGEFATVQYAIISLCRPRDYADLGKGIAGLDAESSAEIGIIAVSPRRPTVPTWSVRSEPKAVSHVR